MAQGRVAPAYPGVTNLPVCAGRNAAGSTKGHPPAQGVTFGEEPAGPPATLAAYNPALPSIGLAPYPMQVLPEVLSVLDEVLSLGGRSASFDRQTRLLGAIPELDSMAVVTLITTLEDRFGITVDDDDIDGDTFASVGALADFVATKLAA